MFGTNSFTLSAPETEKYLSAIQRNSIGLEEWFRRFDSAIETTTNYPPYNLVKENETEFRLELALAGYKKEDIEVTTEWNKLIVEAKKIDESADEYVYRGLAKRAFTRTWTLSDDVIVGNISFVDGLLTIKINRVIPDHQKKKYMKSFNEFKDTIQEIKGDFGADTKMSDQPEHCYGKKISYAGLEKKVCAFKRKR